MSPATENSMGSGNVGSRHFHNRRFVLRSERVEARACARTQAELGGGQRSAYVEH